MSNGFNKKFYQRAQSVQLVRGGAQFFSILGQLIDEAEIEIHFQFYILENDETGSQIIRSLIRAANKGVNVYVVLDKYGSGKLNSEILNDFEKAGIHFKWFRPVFTFGNLEFGRRMHHKIVSIDEKLALTTGVNIANRYNDINSTPAWLDFALIVEGPTAMEIKKRCLQIWEKNYELGKLLKKFRLPHFKGVRSENALVKVSVNDWLRGRNEIYTGYLKAISQAQNEIIISGGYFLPGRFMRKHLHDAAMRGVSISVILTKVSDVRFAKAASEYLYRWMFKSKIRIYEWEPNVMHGKVAVVDKSWSTVGSFNLNYLSAFESIELNMEIISSDFSNQLNELLKKIAREECAEITEESYFKNFSVYIRFRNWISYIFVRYAFRLLNLFSKKPKML